MLLSSIRDFIKGPSESLTSEGLPSEGLSCPRGRFARKNSNKIWNFTHLFVSLHPKRINNDDYGQRRYLLNVCGLIDELSEEQLRFIAHIEPMYIEARYPEQKAATARTLSKEVSQYFIEQTKQLTQWIEERLHETKP